MAGDILVVAEHQEGAVKRPSLEALTCATGLAGGLGGEVIAVLAGAGAADAAAACGQHGAARVLTLDVDPADTHAWAAALAGVAGSESPACMLFSHTARGKDVAPRVAGLVDAPLASDCTGLSVDGGTILARRPVYAGKALVNVSTDGLLLASLRPNAIAASESPAAGAVSAVDAAAPANLGAVLKEIMAAASEKIELTEAAIVVSGGRGLKEADNFSLIEDLAEALGGAVGASRAVVDAGWRPHGEQVGQTGKTVSPNLYVAVAISGAIQHLAGMRTSNYIVAVNKDPEAPIFKVADYGIVGDAFEVVPRLTEAVKALKAQV